MTTLLENLPKVEGSYREAAPLKDLTWFRVGGPAQVLFKPRDTADLQKFLARKPANVAVTVIGVGSNMIVRDGGIDGVVIRLGSGFSKIQTEGNKVIAGAAALDAVVAKQAQRAGITGLEFLVGVPGTIGGALRMNAGAHGGETKDFLVSAKAVSPDGKVHDLSPAELGHSYRHCSLPADWIFVEATFECEMDDIEIIADKLKAIQRQREETQPIRSKTGGSTFKNPPGLSAWKIVDAAGYRGHQVGGAQVSEMHCNFLINKDNATAHDIETLGEEVRKNVFAHSGTKLNWEIKRLGNFMPNHPVATFEETIND
jgi:UDP-N-acetylmuramate dehydrogenase